MTRYFLFVCFVLVALFFTVATPAHAAETIFIVNDTTDLHDLNPGDGICGTRKTTCTLRAAIQESNAFCGGDYYCEETIELPAGLFKLTRTGADDNAIYGDLDITGSVTIRGAGSADTTIDGNAGVVNDRIFHLIGDPLVTHYVHFEDLTLINGKNKRGGAIYNHGMHWYFTDSKIHNSVSTYWGGGAIYNEGGWLQVSGSVLSDNTAQGTYGFGGAISNQDADLTVSDSLLMQNTAAGSWSYGGAIYSISGGVALDHTTVALNTSTRYGGGIYLSNGWLHIYKSAVQDNYAATAGGGLMVNSAATLKLEQSSVTGNMADINVGDGGGGLYLETDLAEITDSQISGNLATVGGGLYNHGGDTFITRTTISDNAAFPDGGGVYHAFGALTLVQSTVSANQASRGAGLFNHNNNYAYTTLTLVNTTVSGNVAKIDGGGVYNHQGDVALYNATIAANQADGDQDKRGAGGGIYNQTGGVRLQNTLLADNFHPDTVGDVPDDCYGKIESGGYNLIEANAACTILGDQTGNIIGSDPELGPLQNNGGPTHTHAFPQTSKALEAADPAGCLDHQGLLLEKDQRDYQRHFDGDGDGVERCDIGALEYM